jgi:hypothetical protein
MRLRDSFSAARCAVAADSGSPNPPDVLHPTQKFWNLQNKSFCDSRICLIAVPIWDNRRRSLPHLNMGPVEMHPEQAVWRRSARRHRFSPDQSRGEESMISGVESVARIARFEANKCLKEESGRLGASASQ